MHSPGCLTGSDRGGRPNRAEPSPLRQDYGGMDTKSKNPDPAEVAAKAEQQKRAARAPQQPPSAVEAKPRPPESGKPVWDKPHSS